MQITLKANNSNTVHINIYIGIHVENSCVHIHISDA